MRRATTSILVALLVAGFHLTGWCSDPSPVQIPGPGQGYEITKSDSSQPAPSGYEGRTDTSSETATGDTPATKNKRITASFKLGNQIKACPLADGTAEGTGVFSITVDSTDKQPNGTARTHIEMRAEAKYKGKVGDDGYLQNPVNAEIDFTYKQTGTIRDASSALVTPAGGNVQQHITIPFGVGKDLSPPSIGAFAGGDPTKGHYVEAYGVGAALAYWAGFYYSVAETKWMQGHCVEIVFDPPSNTVQPAPGTHTTVKAQVKTKAGESVKAAFQNAQAYSGGTVTPAVGVSDAVSPLPFLYTAPKQKTRNAGFGVGAVSHAGAAKGEWLATLGTDWSGEISFSRTGTAAEDSELMRSSGGSVNRLTITVKNGVATASGYAHLHGSEVMRQKALRGGAITLIDTQTDSGEGAAEGMSRATVQVFLDSTNKTYNINIGMESPIIGNRHSLTCNKTYGCHESDFPLDVDMDFCQHNGIGGKLTDSNHLQGSFSDVRPNIQRQHGTGTLSCTVAWDLARLGSK